LSLEGSFFLDAQDAQPLFKGFQEGMAWTHKYIYSLLKGNREYIFVLGRCSLEEAPASQPASESAGGASFGPA
jgi:hypothetical protein